MDNVDCAGNESCLAECHHRKEDDCEAVEGAGVKCGELGNIGAVFRAGRWKVVDNRNLM